MCKYVRIYQRREWISEFIAFTVKFEQYKIVIYKTLTRNNCYSIANPCTQYPVLRFSQTKNGFEFSVTTRRWKLIQTNDYYYHCRLTNAAKHSEAIATRNSFHILLLNGRESAELRCVVYVYVVDDSTPVSKRFNFPVNWIRLKRYYYKFIRQNSFIMK